jgi:hypothetical protein
MSDEIDRDEIDPDAPNAEGAERNKSFGENMKDAAHDLKEDAKDAFRRSDDDEEDDDEQRGEGEGNGEDDASA